MVSENNMKMENILFVKNDFHSFLIARLSRSTKKGKKKGMHTLSLGPSLFTVKCFKHKNC